MLHFPDPFFIHVPLGFLMATIVGSTGWRVVGRCVGIKNPDIYLLQYVCSASILYVHINIAHNRISPLYILL